MEPLMIAYQDTASFGLVSRPNAGLKRLVAEVTAFASAIASPNRIIAEVERMQELRRQADRAEARDPELARALRRQAARVGLN